MIFFFSDLLELSINNYIVEISLDYIGSEMSGLSTRGFLCPDEHVITCRKGSSFHLTCLEEQNGIKVCYLELGKCFLKPFQDRHAEGSNFPGTTELPTVIG